MVTAMCHHLNAKLIIKIMIPKWKYVRGIETMRNKETAVR